MKLYPYWVSDTRAVGGVSVSLRAGSDRSEADARDRLERGFQLVRDFRDLPAPAPEDVREFRESLRVWAGAEDDGAYQRPICEEILRTLDSANIVTRNGYGAEVLNSEDTCFIDVDSVPWRFTEILVSIFSFPSPGTRCLARVRRLAARPENRDLGFRVYETAAGCRVIADGPGLEPGSGRVHALFAELGADSRYARLCDIQRCFRARLTPKPYRLPRSFNVLPKDIRFPYEDETSRREAARWAEEYKERSKPYAVCRFVGEAGRPVRSSVVEFHDETTGAESGRPLR